jgi:hypothetical protein
MPHDDEELIIQELCEAAIPLFRVVVELKNRARAIGYDMDPAIEVTAPLFGDGQLVFKGVHLTRVITVKAKP